MNTAKALEVWTAQTLCNIGILLSVLSFLLHIARPYFDRILGRFTLRVAADLWWVAYVVLRDGSLLAAVLLGFLTLNLDLMADIKVGLPFVPLATVLLAAALLVKLLRDTEQAGRPNLVCTSLVVAGALLNTLGYVLVMEAPGHEYAAAESAFWKTMVSWRSNQNPALSTATFYLCFSLLLALGLLAAWKGTRPTGGARSEAE